MEQVRILIDTDLGDDVDDTAALMLALACPEIEIVGITTVFKDTGKRAQMVRDLLRFYGKEEIPVLEGYGRAIHEQRFDCTEAPIQYSLLEGRGADSEVAAPCVWAEDFILDQLRQDPELVIVAMGPMTNLAMACLRDPKRMSQARMIGMGGSFFSSAPEWNIICDPEAADIVLRTSKNLTMMGLDVTRYLKIGQDRLNAWEKRKDPIMNYFLKGVGLFQAATGYPVTFHDVLLIAYLLDPGVVELRKGSFAVELAGSMTRGTMVDRSDYYEITPVIPDGFRYAVSVDLPRFFKILDRRF